MITEKLTAEQQRLIEHANQQANWKHWGPYLSERAWGTVREDYSANGDAWSYFPHDHARSRVYRWNEDGIGGICDRHQYLCFALALWNGRDPILKERLFGLTGPEGSHGEDVKEAYFYLDSTPTHSYMKMLYKYPQMAFPYADLVEENARRGRDAPEYELLDTGAFDEDRYFDVLIEYAKATEEDLLIHVTITNRGPDPAECHLLPTAWFRNTWSWGYENGPMDDVPGRPSLNKTLGPEGVSAIALDHPTLGERFLYAGGAPQSLFTENETNVERLFGVPNASPYVKDVFHQAIIHDAEDAVNPAHSGTKAAFWYRKTLNPGESIRYRLRLSPQESEQPFADFDAIFQARQQEADVFYAAIQVDGLDEDARNVQRQALAGMLWSKQLYYYDVPQWLDGDPGQPRPPESRRRGRNHGWDHLNNFDVLSMPDKWEYPWFAAWDLAFHCLPLALVDPDFAKRQLTLMTRVWYLHPNGQLPAYEWTFDDVNPPVHAWAALHVYRIDKQCKGEADRAFLEGIFHKLLINFTWWVNRKDADDNNLFQGGFLGMDNIGAFDRSAPLPVDTHIDQSDGTAWMGFYCLSMLNIALELAKENPVYQDIGTKFFEHFLRIAHSMSHAGGDDHNLWDEQDGFFYDAIHTADGAVIPMRLRSLVGLLPLLAVAVLEPETLRDMPDFNRRLHWFMDNRPDLAGNIANVDAVGEHERRLLAILTNERLERVLKRMLDEDEFLSPYGIRSMSKRYAHEPYSIHVHGRTYSVGYEPAEAQTGLFGGNSNWRGPVWFPVNFLIIEALRTFHRYHGAACQIECPTGSGLFMDLGQVADELSRRLQLLFLRDEQGRRPAHGAADRYANDPHWRDLVLFYEYFHADNGAGLGASHQTGWTGLVANLIQHQG